MIGRWLVLQAVRGLVRLTARIALRVLGTVAGRLSTAIRSRSLRPGC
jgi:hypothetical protein